MNDRSSGLWTYINSRGFPAMTVPAGFTTQVYDRGASGQLLPPIPAALPVGIDFLGLPFGEPTLFEIAAAYEAATQHRKPPPDFGPSTTGRRARCERAERAPSDARPAWLQRGRAARDRRELGTSRPGLDAPRAAGRAPGVVGRRRVAASVRFPGAETRSSRSGLCYGALVRRA